MADESMVSAKNVTVKYDKNVILDNVSIDIKKGGMIGFLGPSGAGKTTLIKAMIGMKEAAGSVYIDGEAMPSLSVTSQIGYMAQQDALYEDLTGLDNVLFFEALYGLRGKEAKSRAAEVLELVNLSGDAKKRVKYYSGGMRRRLSLAVALAHKPKLLFLDEPTVGIDPVLKKVFWEEFHRLKEEGATIVITTHVMDEAYRCDRLALIRDGGIIADGTPVELMVRAGAQSLEEAFLFYSGEGRKE
ncbi:MAG: ABC transporter ATP-binding protein [Bacillota bacterium]|nr:ABC transporter ATP-binding protein [Bacillota bacterium]